MTLLLGSVSSAQNPNEQQPDHEKQAWSEVDGMDPQALRDFLKQFLDGKFAEEAKFDLELHQKIADMVATTSVGQEYRKGDEVVALRDCELKVGPHPIGTVRRGEKLAIEQIQDKWLWVRSGQTRGWIDSGSVMDAALFVWYRRLPELESVTMSATARAKFAGILFQITNAGTGPSIVGNSQGSIYGLPSRGPFLNATYSRARILLERVGRRESRILWIKFDPPGGDGIQIPPPPGWTTGSSYGLVQPGDLVLIDPSRKVFVNGVHRQPRR